MNYIFLPIGRLAAIPYILEISLSAILFFQVAYVLLYVKNKIHPTRSELIKMAPGALMFAFLASEHPKLSLISVIASFIIAFILERKGIIPYSPEQQTHTKN